MTFITLSNFDDGHMILVNLARVQSIWQRTENGQKGTMLRMADGDAIFVKEPIETFLMLIQSGKISGISM